MCRHQTPNTQLVLFGHSASAFANAVDNYLIFALQMSSNRTDAWLTNPRRRMRIPLERHFWKDSPSATCRLRFVVKRRQELTHLICYELLNLKYMTLLSGEARSHAWV